MHTRKTAEMIVKMAEPEMQLDARKTAAATADTSMLHWHVCLDIEVWFIFFSADPVVFIAVQL